MKVEKGGSIRGVPASALKELLKRHRDGFTTMHAMARLGLMEPEASRTLHGLDADGYVTFAGERDGIDRWEVGDVGRRLRATRLGKRFPASEGREILEAIVTAAREANADEASPLRVTWIALFGSMLDATEEDDVGDVDLMVRMGRRKLPPEQSRRLSDAQLETAPEAYRSGRAYGWSNEVLRRVSAKASVMDDSALTMGIRHQVVYAYDVATEAEIAATGTIEVSTAEAEEVAGVDGMTMGNPSATAGRRRDRPWPDPPEREPKYGEANAHLAPDAGLLAQHLWMTGTPLDELALRIWTTEWGAQAYLAAQATRPEGPMPERTSLRAAIADDLGGAVSGTITIEVHFGKGRRSGVRVNISPARPGAAASRATLTGEGLELGGDLTHAPVAERACRIADAWRKSAAKRIVKIVATCTTEVAVSDASAGDLDRDDVPDFGALRAAFAAWALRAPIPRIGNRELDPCLVVNLAADPTVTDLFSETPPVGGEAVETEARGLWNRIHGTGLTWDVTLSARS